MPHDPDPPPAKRFKPGSPFFRLNKKPGMLLPRKENASVPVDVQRKHLPIYQAKSQLINRLRQLDGTVLIGKQCLGTPHLHRAFIPSLYNPTCGAVYNYYRQTHRAIRFITTTHCAILFYTMELCAAVYLTFFSLLVYFYCFFLLLSITSNQLCMLCL